jgi:hypothetical protein
MDETEAAVRLVSIFHKQKLDWIKESTRDLCNQWHNLKYYTWGEEWGQKCRFIYSPFASLKVK